MPARRSRTSSVGANSMRTGTRCTTLTQFPLAFCGGRIANCAPVPGLTAATMPRNVRPGKVSTEIVDRLADAQMRDVGFLRVGVDPGRAVVDQAEHRRAGGDVAADLDARDLRRHAGDRRAQHGVVEIALGLVERGRGLRVGRIFLDRQVGVAEQLVADALAAAARAFELRLRRDQRHHRVVHVGLRAGAVGEQRVLAVDIALLQLEGLARERDALSIEARLVFRFANSVRTLASRASACVTVMRNGSGSISISASPALTRWPSRHRDRAILPEISGVISTFCAPT